MMQNTSLATKIDAQPANALAEIADRQHALLDRLNYAEERARRCVDRLRGPVPESANKSAQGPQPVPTGSLGEMKATMDQALEALERLHSAIENLDKLV